MAISQGSLASYSDLANYYNTFNNFIATYGGNITQLTIPSQNKKIEASDVNNLDGKITEFQSETYLSTQASWWVNANVTVGDLIQAIDWDNVNTTVTNMARVQCRNISTNNKGNNGECCNTYSTHSQCCDTNSTNANCCNTNSTNGNCCNTNSTNGNCCNTNSTHSQTCQNGSGTTTFYWNGWWRIGDWSWNSSGWWDVGYRYSSNCSNGCLNAPYSAWYWNGGWVAVTAYTCSVACGNGCTQSACKNGNHGQACKNGNHGQVCKNGNHGQNCQNGTNSKNPCNNGQKTNTCSNTQVIDITCQQATKSNA